jgi:hypothetical protein
VSNLNDSGAGSFRQAIPDADAAGADVIRFPPGTAGTVSVGTSYFASASASRQPGLFCQTEKS